MMMKFSAMALFFYTQLLLGADGDALRMIPHVTRSSGDFLTRIIIANEGEEEAKYQLVPYLESGVALAPVDGMIAAGETLFRDFEGVFPSALNASHFRIIAQDQVKIWVTYSANKASSPPVHIAENRAVSRSWKLFHGLDWDQVFDGLAVVNAGPSSARISIRHLGENGTLVEPAVELGPIPANGKILYTLNQDFTQMENTYFEVRSKNDLALTVIRGTFETRPLLTENQPRANAKGFDVEIQKYVVDMMRKGRHAFRYDTFGDEDFWGGTLRLHEGVAQVSPLTALAVGLKVDVQALPEEILDALKIPQGEPGAIDLNDPAITVALLKLNAVVGVTGFFKDESEPNRMTSIGLQCSFCHATVDDSFAPGIGNRLDGWPNRDLDVGTIVSLAPDLSVVSKQLGLGEDTAAQDAVRNVIRAWGPGKYDASVFIDGRVAGGPGSSSATLIPPAYGLSGTNMATFTGWGSVTYWNAFVANLELHGKGTFVDPRLDSDETFPVAAANGFSEVRAEEDLITPKLAALNFYQMALPSPKPPVGSFEPEAALRGEALFNGKANCKSCHVPPIYTEPGYNLHTAEEIGIDDFQASRSPSKRYRTSPLGGLWARAKGGYYHDGRFEDLAAVVTHYNNHFNLALNPQEAQDLVAFLKSL